MLINLPLSFLVRSMLDLKLFSKWPFFKIRFEAGYPALAKVYSVKAFELEFPKKIARYFDCIEGRLDIRVINIYKKFSPQLFLKLETRSL